MKKICLLYVFALACLTVKAQNYIVNLDDITISGEWNLASTEIPMDFIKSLNAYEYDIPLKIVLNDSGNSYIVLGSGMSWMFKGYWVTTAQTGKYFLHMMPYNSDESIVNFHIVQFDNGKMVLDTYKGNDRVEFSKDTSLGVPATRMDAKTGKTYNLDGVELETPNNAKGVIIQDGKKILR